MVARRGFLTIPAPYITGVNWHSPRRLAVTDRIARNEKQLGAILCRACKQTGLTWRALGSKIHLRLGTASDAREPALQLRTLMRHFPLLALNSSCRRATRESESDIEDLF
ncbi:transcriptional regulator [Mesorhizobium caraganae]|uniref:transcriptional regulator n=1 Tax=Mesorhizobium caraganae TaxID=483206 RepID=UPI001FEDEA8A|nr:transcriptional regulator [Mesorhizobium caraganae]